MSDKCVLGSCCCGCTLRTGALVTAILCLIGGIINTAGALYQVFSEHSNSGWFNAIVNIIMLIIAILLLHGVRTEKARLIRVWVYVQIVLVLLLIVSTIVSFVGTLNIVAMLINLVFILIFIYLILVVRSYALQLESSTGAGRNTV